MLEGDGWSGEFKDLEIQFKQLPKELYESKEAQDVLSFAKKFGAPSYVRMQAWNEWAGLYVDHVIASLEKEDVPKTNPFYKQMLSAQNQNFNNNPYYKFMMRRMTGFEAGGKITKAVRDVLRGADAVDAQAKAEEVVSNPNRRIGLNLKENALADLLDGGSLKNIFQNNGKNSFIDEYLVQIKDPQIKDRIRWQMENRQIADQMLFGIFGSGNKKENHPLSAFFHPNGVEDIGEWGDAYGKISLVMKKDVEARATMTAGDSLAGSFFGASPLNEPKAVGVEGGWAGMVNNELPSFENSYMNKYFEAQIFGGIEISDVAYVAVPQGFKFENPDLEQKLKSRGVRVIEVPSSGFVNEPDDLKIKADGKGKPVLLAYSDDSKLYSTGEDTGYIVSDSGKRIKVQSISAVLKFGNWIFNTGDSGKPLEEKGFVNFVSRSTDPDTYSDPESARIRARNLGCIGIRRYTARDGKLVWLPCTNVSDYNRVTGIRGDNSPRNNPRRQGSGFKKKSETEEKALGRSIGGYRRMFKPIGGVGALEDGDGDGFATGADGEDNIPVAKVPKPKNKKPAPKKKAPKKRLTPQQQRERTRWENQLRRDELAKRKREIEFEIERRKPDVPRLPPGMVNIDKAREVKKHWDDLVDNLFEQAEWGNDEKAQEKKKRKLLAQAYVATARKFKLSPKQVQQHMNEVGRRVYDDLPWVWRPEDLPVRDIMLVRGAKPSQKDALSDGIISFKGVPKPKKKPPTVTSTDINNLAVMVRKNNAKAKTSAKTNLRDLKVVFVRGLSDGGREEANNRVSKFLSLLNSDKPKDVKYSEDNDLLPIDHPWKNRKTAKKWADFEEGEYGVKYAGGCCPKVVKRYRPK
jgi:Holliday junction resolvase